MEKIGVVIHIYVICFICIMNICDKFITLSSHAWYIISNGIWWDELSSFIWLETGILSLIQTLDSVSILFGKVMGVFDEPSFCTVG